ncbi:class I SAM-dependent methyltransferase [Streptomyces sp. NPDC006798]|uniref:class I SAM-dependent methyltransferase n=1 Tax=Streptomyces sp. NPDC006798 TaxID=3155462 RepID=UPI00340DF4FE
MTDYPMTEYWNHNTHYHPLVLGQLPAGAAKALDIGCGEGALARRLAGRVPEVTGVDRSGEMVRQARERGGPGTSYVEGDFLDRAGSGLADGTYDLVSAVAVLHHVDLADGLTRMAELLAPGGRLVVVGCAREGGRPQDWAFGLATVLPAVVANRVRGRGSNAPAVPVMDPVTTYADVRRTARSVLPGCSYRRLLYWRYALVWRKPG